MKKLLWFTEEQQNLLKELKTVTGLNNSELIRESMKVYAKKKKISHKCIDAKRLAEAKVS